MKILKILKLLSILYILKLKISYAEPSIRCEKQNYYTCNLETFDTTLSNYTFPSTISHVDGYSDVQVKYIVATKYQTIHKFPVEIFTVFNNLVDIEIKSVNMKELNESFFKCNSLEWLKLQYNQIPSLSRGIFQQCTNLISILLGFNRITTIAEDSFHGLPQLNRIEFDNNYLESIPENIFAETPKLYALRMNKNRLRKIPSNLIKYNHKLSFLPIEDNPDLKGILPEYFFANYLELKTLWIENINLVEFPKGLFTNTTQLCDLYIKNNKIKRIRKGVFNDLINLCKLDLQENSIDFIEIGAFSGQSKLLSLLLGKNNLNHLNLKIFKPLLSLKLLDLRNNPIIAISFEFFHHLSYLEECQISNFTCAPGTIRDFSVSLSKCFTNILQCEFELHEVFGYSCIFNDTNVSMNYNEIIIIEKEKEMDVKYIRFNIKMSKILIEIFEAFNVITIADFSGTGLSDNGLLSMANCSSNCNSLQVLILDNNYFTAIPIEIKYFKNLQNISLANNRISQIYPTIFSSFSNINFLNISSNEINFISSFAPFKEIDASNNKFEIISKVTNDIEILNINKYSGHALVNVYPDAFRNSPKLKKLFMSNRNLKSLQFFEFNGILEVLDLSFNKLSTVNFSEIPGLKNLKILNISNNVLNQQSFGNLFNLEILDLKNNHIGEIDEILFKKLTMLTHLYLDRNFVKIISKNLFSDQISLEILSLFFNEIQVIQRGAFANLKNLKYLELSGNQFSEHLHFDIFVNLKKLELLNLKNSSLQTIPSSLITLRSLNSLNLSNNLLKSLVFTPNFVDLKVFDISNNNISDINPKIVSSLKSDTKISASINPCIENSSNPLMSFDSCFLNFRNINFCEYEQKEKIGLTCRISSSNKNSERKFEVRYLYNKNKPLEVEVYAIFEIYENLVNVDLWKSSVMDINGINNCINLKHLDLRFNLIENLHENSFFECENLEKLILVKNKISIVDRNALKGLKILKFLDLSFNQIEHLEGETFQENLGLEKLLLGFNKISVINSGLFSNLVNLKVLKFSNNLLTEIDDPEMFQNQSNLLELHFNSNNLNQIHQKIFGNFKKLKYLNLEKNQLTKIDLRLLSSKYFNYFDISFNNAKKILINFREIPNLMSFFGEGNFCIDKNYGILDKNEAYLKLGDCQSIVKRDEF